MTDQADDVLAHNANTPPPRAAGLAKRRRRGQGLAAELEGASSPAVQQETSATVESVELPRPASIDDTIQNDASKETSTADREKASEGAPPHSGIISSREGTRHKEATVRLAPSPPETAADDEAEPDDLSDDEITEKSSVYLLPEAIIKARTLKQEGNSFAETATNALDAALDKGLLEHLVRRRRQVERPANSRFPARRAVRKTTKRPSPGSSRTTWQPRFSMAELRVIDAMQTQVGAQSRSELISVAVEWFLLPEVREVVKHEMLGISQVEPVVLDD